MSKQGMHGITNSPHDVMSLQCKLLDRKRGKEEKSSKDVEQIG